YSPTFRTVTVFLAAVGLVLTPIYLLSMLRQLFYGTDAMPACNLGDNNLTPKSDQEAVCFGTSCVLPGDARYDDAYPREVFIAACFLLPIIAVGLYPKLATQAYDATTVAVNSNVRQSYVQIAETNPGIYANGLTTPQIPHTDFATISVK
ncbi:MAG: dehydrogenase subunit 4, partial [Cyanobacteriota bacterium]